MPVALKPGRDLSIDRLRTMITVGVLFHHSTLAYATWAAPPSDNLFRSVVPIVDSTRWKLLDYVIGYNDAFFMALMFFISGLFVVPALQKHGTGGFIRDRLARLGLPFLFCLFVLNPIAYYIPWLTIGHTTGFIDMYRHLAASRFSSGAAWFIWFLLVMDLGMAAVLTIGSRARLTRFVPKLREFTGRIGQHPFEAAAAMFFLTALVYIPMLYQYGYGRWIPLVTSPFTLQISRLFLYPLWFAFGALVGAWGLSRGLLSRDGVVARRWPSWMAASFLLFGISCLLRVLAVTHPTVNAHSRTPPTLIWVAFCVCSCFAYIGLFSRIRWSYQPWTQSFTRCAYGMYLVHYIFIVAAQRLFLDRPIHPAIKISAVFGITLLLSWLTTKALLLIPKVRAII